MKIFGLILMSLLALQTQYAQSFAERILHGSICQPYKNAIGSYEHDFYGLKNTSGKNMKIVCPIHIITLAHSIANLKYTARNFGSAYVGVTCKIYDAIDPNAQSPLPRNASLPISPGKSSVMNITNLEYFPGRNLNFPRAIVCDLPHNTSLQSITIQEYYSSDL